MSGRKQFDVEVALDAAMRVFWEHGYAQASLDLLTSATGLGRGSLYGAFGDKDALFQRALDRYSAIYGTRQEAALADHADDPARAVEAFFDVSLARIADPDVPGGCLIVLSACACPDLAPASQKRVRRLLDLQYDRLRTALSASAAPSAEVNRLARFVVAVNQSLAVLHRSGTPVDELRSVARTGSTAVADALARYV